MPRYFIHIGPRRTGSRYIQSRLFHARDYLEEHGVIYPDIWWKRPDKIMHDAVAQDLKAGKDLKPDFAKLHASGAKTVVISFEEFEDLTPTALEQLKEYIAGHPVQIICYARRWSDRIPSIWRERVSVGSYETFPECYIRLMSSQDKTINLNYSVLWKQFSNVFGRDTLRIVSYSNLVDRGIDLFEHFCTELLGVNEVPQTAEGLIQRNAWPDMIDAEIVRALNHLHHEETSRTNSSMRIKLDRLKKHYGLEVLRGKLRKEFDERPKFIRIELQDVANSLRPAWQEMCTYVDRLVSPQYGEEIFARRTVEVSFVRPNYLLRDGALDELTKLYTVLKAESVGPTVLPAV